MLKLQRSWMSVRYSSARFCLTDHYERLHEVWRAQATKDLVNRQFRADRPNQLRACDLERHEALVDRAVVKGHRHRLVAASHRS